MFCARREAVFTLDTIKAALGVDKRKIYDVVNVLTSLRFVRRVCKGQYKWNSLEKARRYILEVHERSAVSAHAPHLMDRLATQLLSAFPPGSVVTTDAALEALRKNGSALGHIKVRKVTNALRIFTALGIAQIVPARTLTIIVGDPEDIGMSVDAVVYGPSVPTRGPDARCKRSNPQIINMDELLNRDRLSHASRETSEPQKRKNSYEYRQIMEGYIRSGSIILPKVKIPKTESLGNSERADG